MDSLTHAFLGGAIGLAVSRRSFCKKSLAVGMIAGMTPDLDVFIRSSQNPTLSLLFHRNFTHSLLFIPVGGLLVGMLFLLFFKKWRPQWPDVLLAAVAAYATHGLLDAATSYGTLLLWPFSYRRIAWDLIAIIDPIFTLILVMGVVWGYKKQSRYPPCLALFFCLLYLAWGGWQHERALTVQRQLAASRDEVIRQGRVLPDLGNLLGFHSVYISGERIYLDDIKTPLFKPAYAVAGVSTPVFGLMCMPAALIDNKTLLQDFKIFNWFADGYVTAVSQQPLVLGDMRYTLTLEPLRSLWGIAFPTQPGRRHVYWQSISLFSRFHWKS